MATFRGGVVLTLAGGVVALLAVSGVISGVASVVASAAVAIGLIPAGAFLWQLGAYLWNGGADEWLVTAFVAGNAIKFGLEREPMARPERFDTHLELRCRMTTPDGTQTIESKPAPYAAVRSQGEARLAFVNGAPVSGLYEVRWYGSQRPGRFYELTCVRFDLDASAMGHFTVGTALRPSIRHW
jgi:hypothetical protein